MKKIFLIFTILFANMQANYAQGILTSVYLNPVTGNDANNGSSTFPVRTWDQALQLAASNATVFVAGGTVAITTNTTIDGAQYGASNITVTPNTGYTGALFTVAGGVTGTITNLTLQGVGAAQALLSVNSNGTLTIGASLHITNMGQIALDGGANPINLTATPPAGMNYRLSTTYTSATDEGRAIVNAGSVGSPLAFFTLIDPQSNANVAYELALDGATIRLYERAIGGVYLDPLNGNDAYSGARSNRPVRTLTRATAIWNSRNAVMSGIITDIFVLTRITLTANLTLDGGIRLTRFAGDSDRSTTMTDYLIVYSGYDLTIDDATVNNGINASLGGTALYSASGGSLTLNNGATLTSANSGNIIESNSNGNVILNAGSTIISTSTGTNAYCMYLVNSSSLTINDGMITSNAATVLRTNSSGPVIINGGTIMYSGNSYCFYDYSGSITINDCDITITGTGTNHAFYFQYTNFRMENGVIRNQRTSSGNTINYISGGSLTMNGGTVDAGLTCSIYAPNSTTVTLNGGTVTSSNTNEGAIYTNYGLTLNGQNVVVNGIINMRNTALETYFITVTSPAVTQNYTIRIADNMPYGALVKSNPVYDLGPYLVNFTLEPKQGYSLTAYANKGEPNRHLVLYDTEGIYVNDFIGSDTNPGTSPDQPVKTLVNAAGKTTSVKTSIYICDSTLTVSSVQTITPSAPKDTIRSFMFRNTSNLIRIIAGGDLTLQNIAVYAPSLYINQMIRIEAGDLQLNVGASIFSHKLYTGTSYTISQAGGNVVLNSGSLISGTPGSTAVFLYSYGIYKTGANSMLTVADNVIIERQGYGGISNTQGVAMIGAATIQYCTSYLTNNSGIAVSGGTVSLNGTVIQNNTYRALTVSGNSAVINMTNGLIENNGGSGREGAVYIQSQGTFNFSGGTIQNNNTPTGTITPVNGEQVYITTGGKMNFSGGTVAASGTTVNAVYVHASSTTLLTSGHITLSDQAVLNTGFIYCSTPNFPPVSLSQPLSPSKKFNINIGDNMAGCVVVDGTSTGIPASVGNFDLNPGLSVLSLQQSGDDVVVGSSAIYLDGVNGNDANNGSSAAQAVKTFGRAKAIMAGSPGSNLIVMIGTVSINTADESWELDSINPNAVVQRGLGFTGYFANVSGGRTLTLSGITLDGNRENVNVSVNAVIYTAEGCTLNINSGTKIQNNNQDGIYVYRGNCYMNGGEISNNSRYGVYFYSLTSRADEFIMTGGKISNNTSEGIRNYYGKYVRMFGGEISQNGSYGIYNYQGYATQVLEIGGTARISENTGYGIYGTSTMDSVIVSGGEVINNGGYGIAQYTNHVYITGGTISNNGNMGLSFNAPTVSGTTSADISGMTVENNTTYGARFINFNEFSMSGGTISGNTTYGLYVDAGTANTSSVFSLTGGSISNNNRSSSAPTSYYGVYIVNYANMTVENTSVSNNNCTGIYASNPAGLPGNFVMSGGEVCNNANYGLSLNNYISYTITGNVRINGNQNTAVYSNAFQPSFISGDVLIKGNRSGNNAGGLYIYQGTVNISDNVTFEADTCTNYAGGIYVAAIGRAVISGNVQIRDCRNMSSTVSVSYGGSAIYALGALSMTGGSITGCETPVPSGSNIYGSGTVYVSGASSNVALTNVTLHDNSAGRGGAIYVASGGKITLDTDTLFNNTTYYMTVNAATAYTTPATGAIHLAGGAGGRLSLRDKCYIEGDIYVASRADTVYVDESLLFSDIGAFHLLAYNTGSTAVTTPGTVVVSPNGTTLTDASQFLTRFTLMNAGIGRGLDKGGTDDNHIMIVNQFFIDCSHPTADNGSSPSFPFNSLTQAAFTTALNTAYTTVWVSGPVFTKQTTTTLPVITRNNVNIRRYTGFAVAAQPYQAYDSVMITVEPGHTLAVQGGNSSANTFTISGEGGSPRANASIFRNNGTLTVGGYTNLFFNPTAGDGAAVYQNGTFNLSGDVAFNLYSPNTIYLPEGRVINIPAQLNTSTPVGITVETSPVNTHIPGRVVVTGPTANVTPGMVNLFYNEIQADPLPIGYASIGSVANLMFYIADRNVAGIPIYMTLQDAFDAAVPDNNDEVRLYGNTEEAVFVDKQLRYNSQGFAVQGSFTLDSVSRVQLLDDLSADTLFIRANTFSNKAQLDLNGQSLTILKAAYLDLRLPDDATVGDWYPVNLPFDARLSDIRDASDTLRQIIHMQDFAIAEYSTQRRANYGIGNQPSNPENDWQFLVQPTMTGGTGYMATASDIQTLRFKAGNLNLFTTVGTPLTYATGLAGNIHYGINYVAQPLSMNAVITGGIPAGSIIQVSESLSSDRIGAASYVPKAVNSSLVIAPYTNYFYQTTGSGSVAYTPSTNVATVRSGGLSPHDVPFYYELRFYADNPLSYDALFVATSEYASKERYEIGRDVIKMGTLDSQTAQIWSRDFDVALCANEALLENGKADIPLFIHTPVAGKEYRLHLLNTGSDREQLWLCRAGKPVQNLTVCPEFVIEGTGFTTDEYTLIILSGETANMRFNPGDIYVNSERNAIIINGTQPGDEYRIFDMSGHLHATGKAVGNRTRINVSTGVYIVRINGKQHKTIVQ